MKLPIDLQFLRVLLLLGAVVTVCSEISSSDYRKHVLENVLKLNTDSGGAKKPPKVLSFLSRYDMGIDAYLQNDFDGCVYHIESAIRGYHEYYDTVVRCRRGCETERANHKRLFEENPENIHFFEGVLVKTVCLKRCMAQQLTNVPSQYFSIDEWHRIQFESRAPYDYLQLCYYRQNEMERAIQSTYTVLVMRPDDHLATTNMKFYTSMPDFDSSVLKDLEEKKFVANYVEGIVAYDKEDWRTAINLLETSLELFVEEMSDCRAFCDNGFDQGWFPDFVSSTASMHHGFKCNLLVLSL